jgi:hypothetical protein
LHDGEVQPVVGRSPWAAADAALGRVAAYAPAGYGDDAVEAKRAQLLARCSGDGGAALAAAMGVVGRPEWLSPPDVVQGQVAAWMEGAENRVLEAPPGAALREGEEDGVQVEVVVEEEEEESWSEVEDDVSLRDSDVDEAGGGEVEEEAEAGSDEQGAVCLLLAAASAEWRAFMQGADDICSEELLEELWRLGMRVQSTHNGQSVEVTASGTVGAFAVVFVGGVPVMRRSPHRCGGPAAALCGRGGSSSRG